MAVCQKIRVNHRALCANDLDRKVKIKTRSMVTSQLDTDMSVGFTSKTVWAAVKTAKGNQTFFATNMQDVVDHIIYIRWYDGVTSENWVEYKGDNYDIIDVENLDERDEWYALYCNVRGTTTKEVNDA